MTNDARILRRSIALSHRRTVACIGAAALAIAFALPSRADAQTPPAETKTTTITVPVIDHRVELTPRGGVLIGGEMTPKGSPVGKTDTAPLFFGDISVIAHPFFTVGVFAGFGSGGYKRYLYDQPLGDGTFSLLTTGASFKARLALSDDAVLRIGILVGRNFLWASGTVKGTAYEGTGGGINLAPTVEGSFRLSRTVGISGQLSFISQPSGTGSSGGKDVDFAFAPLWFVAVGPEFYL